MKPRLQRSRDREDRTTFFDLKGVEHGFDIKIIW